MSFFSTAFPAVTTTSKKSKSGKKGKRKGKRKGRRSRGSRS